jgi:hypothetical protein
VLFKIDGIVPVDRRLGPEFACARENIRFAFRTAEGDIGRLLETKGDR